MDRIHLDVTRLGNLPTINVRALENAVSGLNRVTQEKAERERKAAEATIELNEQTKTQIRLLREQNQKLNETIMQLKNQNAGSPTL